MAKTKRRKNKLKEKIIAIFLDYFSSFLSCLLSLFMTFSQFFAHKICIYEHKNCSRNIKTNRLPKKP